MCLRQLAHYLRNLGVCGCLCDLPFCRLDRYFVSVGKRRVFKRHDVITFQHYYKFSWNAIGIVHADYVPA